MGAVIALGPARAEAASGPPGGSTVRACPAPVERGKAACGVLKRADVQPLLASPSPSAIPSGHGYGPTDLQQAYNLAAAAASRGGGATVALVDAFDNPNAAADLATYRAAAGLPALPSGGFSKINQNGQPSPLPSPPPASNDWTVEASLDVDMVSAICPNCSITLVEAQDNSWANLFAAEKAAAAVAGYISNSWGSPEALAGPGNDPNFNYPGHVITAAAGDSGYGVLYPASSPLVVSVGGTSLTRAATQRGWLETVWGSSAGGAGTGSGCSAFEPKPAWQSDAGCAMRTDNDIAADADPITGVAVYDTSINNGGWLQVGGTSASSPMIAAMYALAGNAGPNPAQDIYQHTASLNQVTSGADGTCTPSYLCTAQAGYNGPAGWGTPDGLQAVSAGAILNTVTVNDPGSQTSPFGTAASLKISAQDSDSSQTLTYAAAGLPPGLNIDAGSGLISGTPTSAGAFTVTVKATDTTGASGTVSFSWTVDRAPAALTISASPNPSDASQPVTLTANVPVVSAVTPTGSVTFASGTTTLGSGPVTLDGSGNASLTVSNLLVGSDQITASYSGDGNYMPASASLTQTVNANLQITTTNLPNAAQGKSYSTPLASTGGTAPITWTANGTLPTGLTLSSAGVLSGTPTSPGTSQVGVTATDANGQTATASLALTVTASVTTTTTSLTSSPNPSAVGQPVTLTAVVAGSNPTGTVTFMDGATALGAVGLSAGTATFTTSSLPEGGNSLTAVYSGDGNNAASTSAPDTQNVARSDVAVTLTASPSMVASGTTVTFTLTVTNNGPDTAYQTVAGFLVPSGIRVTGTSPNATGNAFTFQGTTYGLSWNLGDLAPGQRQTITITASATARHHTKLTASAAAAPVNPATDPIPSNNISATTLTVR